MQRWAPERPAVKDKFVLKEKQTLPFCALDWLAQQNQHQRSSVWLSTVLTLGVVLVGSNRPIFQDSPQMELLLWQGVRLGSSDSAPCLSLRSTTCPYRRWWAIHAAWQWGWHTIINLRWGRAVPLCGKTSPTEMLKCQHFCVSRSILTVPQGCGCLSAKSHTDHHLSPLLPPIEDAKNSQG